jgi:hypothetical protein
MLHPTDPAFHRLLQEERWARLRDDFRPVQLQVLAAYLLARAKPQTVCQDTSRARVSSSPSTTSAGP